MMDGCPQYRIGSDGTVWSCLRRAPKGNGVYILSNCWKRLRPGTFRDHRGPYKFVNLAISPKKYRVLLIHRLVLEAFRGPCPEGWETRHRDGDPSNNNLDNLLWGTKAQNGYDRIRHGRQPKGEEHHKAKLTNNGVFLIRKLRTTGLSYAKIGKKVGVSATTIRMVCIGRLWRHI